MASPLTGYKDCDLLKIETDNLYILIKGKPVHPTVEQFNLHRNDKGDWEKAELNIITYKGEYKAFVFDPFSENNLTEYRPGSQVFPCFYEHQVYNVQIKGKNGLIPEFYHDSKNIRNAITRFDGNIISGNLNFKNDIGFTELQINTNGRPILKLKIEVFPAKIDYRRDFYELLKEVNEEIYNLAYDFLRSTYFNTQISSNIKPSLSEFFNIINLIFDNFIKALERIENSPHHKIIRLNQINCIEKIKRFDYHSAKWLCKHPNIMVKDKHNRGVQVGDFFYIPQKLQESKKGVTFDTFENRFVKWILKKVCNRLSNFHNEYRNLYMNDSSRFDSEIDRNLSKMTNKIQKLSNTDFLTDVSEIHQLDNLSLVLQMAPGYRDVYRYYLMLIKGLSIQSDVFHISLKELSTLYEYWCFLSLHKLLKKKYRLKTNNLIKTTNRGLVVTLRKDRPADITYEDPKTGEVFKLAYQEQSKSPTVGQIPDNVLTLNKEGSSVQYKYVFDAKYRVNSAYDDDYKKKYGKPGPQVDDINTMHRYRDAIVYSNKENGYQRSVFGAFVLFPYADEDLYSGLDDNNPHNFYKSIEEIGIGGLPFLPGHTNLVEQFLNELIIDTAETASERALVHDGTEQYFYNKFLKKNVFVGSLKNTEQWNINYKNKFYHTPLTNVSSNLGSLEYVAIYFSKDLFGESGGIQYYGKIKKYQVLKRCDIKYIPKNSNELYVYFAIEDWNVIPETIKPLNYGVYDRLFTTLPLLLSAKELPELILKDETEIRLWRELRRMVPKSKVIADNKRIDFAKVAEISSDYGSIRIDGDQIIAEVDNIKKCWAIDELNKNRLKIFKELRNFINK